MLALLDGVGELALAPIVAAEDFAVASIVSISALIASSEIIASMITIVSYCLI